MLPYRFKQIVDLANEGIWILDADDRTAYINERGASMLGYRPEDVLGRPVTDFLFPDLGHDAESILSEMRAGKEMTIEFQTRRRDGSLAWMSASIRPLSDGGRYGGAVAIFSDITERNKADEALRESEERFRIMADGSPNPIWVTDTEGERIFTNRRYQEFFGVPPEPTKDGKWKLLLHLDDESTYVDSFMSALYERRSFSAEARVRRADGAWRWIESHAEPRYTRNGEFLGYVGMSSDITEKKLAETALAENREMYRQLVESMTDGVVIHDGGHIIFMNMAGARILGYARPEDTYSLRPIDVVHPDYREVASKRIWGHKGTVQPLIEEKFLRKDGSIVDVDVTTMPYKFADSMGVQVVFRDITERKKMEGELLSSRQMLQLILDNVPDRVFWKDLDLNYLGCNQNAARDAGLTNSSEIVGKNDYDLAWKDSAASYRADDRQVMESGRPKINFEEMQIQTDGRIRWLKTSKVPLRDPDGRVFGLLGTYEDITERKQAEEALSKNLAVLAKSQEIAHLGSWSLDFETGSFKASDEDYRIYGLEPGSETILDQIWSLIHPDDLERYRDYVNSVRTEGRLGGIDYRIVLPDGSLRYLHAITDNVIRSPDGRVKVASGTTQDITEQKELEEYLKRSNEELQQFAFIASHDLREPLRMITAYLDLLCKKFDNELSPQAKEYMTIAIDGSVRMRELIDDLLEYSRLGSRPIEPTKVDMNEVARKVLEILNVSVKEADAQIVVETLPTIMADKQQIGLVLQNLLSNAIKFRGSEPLRIDISANRQVRDWVFSVKDNGIGIDPKYTDKLFKMFSRLHTKEEYPGTGIGLAIVKKIVERHHGRIWFESEPGKGTTFFFTIPS